MVCVYKDNKEIIEPRDEQLACFALPEISEFSSKDINIANFSISSSSFLSDVTSLSIIERIIPLTIKDQSGYLHDITAWHGPIRDYKISIKTICRWSEWLW